MFRIFFESVFTLFFWIYRWISSWRALFLLIQRLYSSLNVTLTCFLCQSLKPDILRRIQVVYCWFPFFDKLNQLRLIFCLLPLNTFKFGIAFMSTHGKELIRNYQKYQQWLESHISWSVPSCKSTKMQIHKVRFVH